MKITGKSILTSHISGSKYEGLYSPILESGIGTQSSLSHVPVSLINSQGASQETDGYSVSTVVKDGMLILVHTILTMTRNKILPMTVKN